MLRRQHYVGGQEKALGILAYIAAFEAIIAKPFREEAKKKGLQSQVPVYDEKALRESLTVNIETKRRIRIQRNVMAAALPAFSAAMLSIANAVYKPATGFDPLKSADALLRAIATQPMNTAIYLLKANQWAFLGLVVFGYFWVAYFTGVLQPSEAAWVKGPTQAAAVWGRLRASAFLFALGTICVALLFALLRL
jgi:hypothetical protein